MNGAGVEGAYLAAVCEESKRAPAQWQCVDGVGVGGTCLAAVLEENENTSTSLWGQCVDGAGVGGTCLAAGFEKQRAPALA